MSENINEVKAFLSDLNPTTNAKEINEEHEVGVNLNKRLNDGLGNRSDSYNLILKHYEEYIKETMATKTSNKKVMFFVSIGILVVTVLGTFWFLIFNKTESISILLTTVVPLVVSFLTVFIIIPRLITEYLFNKDEEKYMIELLSKMLEYDVLLKTTMDNKSDEK